MQKIELRQNLKQLIERTKSEKIIEFFANVNKLPGGYSNILLSLVVESKAGFDQSVLDEKQNKILEQFDAKKYYETKFYSNIVKFISTNNYDVTSAFLQKSKNINEFYTYHNTLITSFRLVDNLLFQDASLKESITKESYKEAEDSGFLSFEILSNNSIDFSSYSLVITSINDLVKSVMEFISTIDKTSYEEPPKLILADSGSNTVLTIKLPKEISKSIAKIIDDAWQFLTNRTGYKLEKINKNIGESIDILKKISKAEKDKLITPEQSELWRRGITNSTETIVMNNTLTKSKSEEIYIVSNQRMLMDATKKYLTDGNE